MQKSNNKGCLWTFLVIVVTTLGFGFLKIIGLATLFACIIALTVSVIGVNKLLGKPSKTYTTTAIILCLLMVGGFQLINFLISKDWTAIETDTFNTSEKMVLGSLVENEDTISVYQSNRIWNDNYGNNYNTTLTIREQDYLQLYKHLESYTTKSTVNFWGNLYDYIDRKDTPKLDLVLAAFSEIQTTNNLNQMQFAEMVVSCIQDIPYSFVFEEDCLPPENYEYNIRKTLEQCPDCCIGGVKFGVQNSLSFLQTLKGDCDSRTVLIYSVLKHFGYDVAILNSVFYRHSILGINLPAAGDYKAYNGKRYVLWETTAKYFKAGELPASFNDVTHWNVVLTSK
ncbi:hypothetical protein G5B37_07965 [Rasiella rasia]|uniref:Uncharacterized protein n=1 Tax=Rasiella rasia TaxID=2744027 RepID=A0A6G6GLS3_9FLAO|nr:hypothetical protein [Rasiella rasia]QIE59498.1 hypothetical protein G5B37_07965 [Rasiella rasia]